MPLSKSSLIQQVWYYGAIIVNITSIYSGSDYQLAQKQVRIMKNQIFAGKNSTYNFTI
jgi:hypothetical protein